MDKICSQEKLAEYYNGLSKSKPVMKVVIFPTLPGQERQVLQALEDAGLLDTVDVEIYPVHGQPKRQQTPLMTMRHVHRLEPGKDGRARCHLCGQSYPLDPTGKIDEVQLLRETLLETHL